MSCFLRRPDAAPRRGVSEGEACLPLHVRRPDTAPRGGVPEGEACLPLHLMNATLAARVGPGPPGRMSCFPRRPDTAPRGGVPEGEACLPLHLMNATLAARVGPGPPGRMRCFPRRPDTAPRGGVPEGEACLPLRDHRSRAWFRPSAARLTATTRLAIASAGNNVGHQRPPTRNEYCSNIERPQSGAGGWIPKPMKESVAVANMAYPRRTVNSTNTGPRTLGRISTNIT